MAQGTLRGVEVRGALPADAADIARLIDQLGYPIPPQDQAERVAAVLADRHGTVLVAADWGPLLGVIAVHWAPLLQNARPVARITTLVVDEEARGRGVGRLLLKAGAQAARQAGCDDLELTSGLRRVEAHAFYRAQGFQETSLRFLRNLRRNRAAQEE